MKFAYFLQGRSNGKSSYQRGSEIAGTQAIANAAAKAAAEEQKNGAKRRLNLVVAGHVDAGKSTMMGRLLFDLCVQALCFPMVSD